MKPITSRSNKAELQLAIKESQSENEELRAEKITLFKIVGVLLVLNCFLLGCGSGEDYNRRYETGSSQYWQQPY